MLYRLLLATAVAVITASNPLRGQSQAPPVTAPPLALEIVSVTRNTAGGRGSLGIQPEGRFVATAATLRILIREAYQVQDFQIIGEPSWAATDRFDVIVKAKPGTLQPGGAVPPVQQMLRALLAERFKLKVRTESRQMPAFELTVASADKKTGPGLRAAAVDCAALVGRGSGPPAPASPGERPRCGMRMGPGRLTAGGMPIAQLATGLSQVTGRPVVDRTGLAGSYDVDLSWTPEQFQKGNSPANVPPPPGIDPAGPTLFAAVQNQLGLKLDFGQAPVQTITIESAEPPAP